MHLARLHGPNSFRRKRAACRPLALVALVGAFLLLGGPAAVQAEPTPKPDNPHGPFHDDCGLCHGPKIWKPARISSRFDHGKYGFPLSGAHAAGNCMSCHSSLEFSQSKTQCVSCHKDQHRGEMGTDCARCHGSRSFIDRGPMVRAHQLTRFPLTGGHASLDCQGCHKASSQGHLQFVGTPTECRSCHMAQYQSAPNHAKDGFPLACAQCHGTSAWPTRKFDHNTTAFPLTGVHATTACSGCHGAGVYKGLSTDCQSCHMTQYGAAARLVVDHAWAGFAASNCAGCHGTTQWAGVAYAHSTWPLKGGHLGAACSDCHARDAGAYNQKATNCLSCHQANFAAAAPPHNPADFPDAQCEGCHGMTAWNTGKFNHGAAPATYRLTGAHATVATCVGCHGDGVYRAKTTDCAVCHAANYSGTAGGPFDHGKLGFAASACATCHTITAWTDGKFDHGVFPLTGAHATAACTGCHVNNVFVGIATDCASCHTQAYNAATPNHALAGFTAARCGTCHTSTVQWAGVAYAHSTWPLNGAHRSAACNDCHGKDAGTFSLKATNCLSCHASSFSAAAPPHNPSDFPDARCESCHGTSVWTTGKYAHNSAPATYALTGAHATVATCTGCHGDGVYKAKTTDCAVCHAANYSATTNPNHQSLGFAASACATCHTITAWADGQFDHSKFFVLAGAHATAQCADCHKNNVYPGTPTACSSCHGTSYNAATPNHALAGFQAAQCASCHNSTQWAGVAYAHALWPLKGAHLAAACNDCHGKDSAPFNQKATNCLSCHSTQFSAATPVHDPTNFPDAQCSSCHGTTAWSGGQFDHTARTTYPLVGSHLTLATCAGCHSPNNYNYKAAAIDCQGCHMTQYNATSQPSHQQAGYLASACVTCHTTPTNWTSATFDHSLFPLAGGHAGLQCMQCHSDNVYKGKPTDCQTCHMLQFNSATPNHLTQGFSASACASCHTVTVWADGKFNHSPPATTFALTGAHSTTATCDDCHHDGVYKGKPMNCLSCHQASYTASVPKHNLTDFPDAKCATCHTTSAWAGGKTINHTFPTNHHTNRCADCHVNTANYTDNTCTTAPGCHVKSKINSSHAKRSGYSANAPDMQCVSCHPRGNGG